MSQASLDFAQGLSAMLRAAGPVKMSLGEVEGAGKLSELEEGGGYAFSMMSEPNDILMPLSGWIEDESGGSISGRGSMTNNSSSLLLVEGDSFIVAAQQEITIPENPGKLIIPYSVLSFDMEDPDSINDVFEIALLDSDGYSVVPTLAGTIVDVFFNYTEEFGPFTASGATHVDQTIELDISQLAPGSTPLLVLRLVNNDSDHETYVQFGGSITIDEAEVLEGNTGYATLEFMVRLTHEFDEEVSVDYETVAGTATEGTDYTKVWGTLTFEPGQTALPVEVPVVGDYWPESHETVLLQLSDPVGATIRDHSRAGRILNDDGIEITGGVAASSAEGMTAQQTTFFTDLDTSATHTAVIYWGDGSSDTMTVTESGGSGQAHFNGHVYADDALYNVRVEVTNNHGVTVHNDTQIGIYNWVPGLGFLTSTSAVAGEDFPANSDPIIRFADYGFTSPSAGTSETFSAVIDWGDGSDPEEAYITVTNGSPGVLTVGEIYGENGNPHVYTTPGIYELAITLTDDDGGEVSNSWEITVEEPMFMHSFFGEESFSSEEEFGGGGSFLFSMLSSSATTDLISLSASLPSERVAAGAEMLL
ncbi:MAG: hypothetical protein KF708_09800, partial [Pirellulales bacterium]|nr:hypothetical protein [Pirellulales bacterium]